VIKRRLIKTLTTAAMGAGMLISVSANAVHTVFNMPAIQNGFPSSMADWMSNADKYAWNPENVRLGTHPDRSLGVVYIFPNETQADAWWDGITGNPPTGIPDDAVAYIHWVLDNDSGLFPGIMAISDDKQFKTNNCFMASGTTIPTEDGTSTEDKTCSNYQGSSKRFKLVVMKADAPIDLVFNTTNTVFKNNDPIHNVNDPTTLVYDNYDAVDVEDDIFRTYRYIMKFGNGTGTDTVKLDGTPVSNPGTRLVGFKVQLGYNVGASWTQAGNLATDGVAYELRLCIPDRYFDEASGQTNPGTSDCPAGETELWLGNEFATFSPSMYSLTTDKRTEPIGGYWDKNPAGIYSPQNITFDAEEEANELDSGSGPYIPNSDTDPNNFGGVYDPFLPTDQIGQTTTNYYDVGQAQADAVLNNIPETMFGYLMHYGVFADDDTGNISMGIYRDDDGDPATEGKLHAWWDGSDFRWAIDPDMDGVSPDADSWGLVSNADLDEIASLPMSETEVLTPPRYEFGFMDDLGGLNSDTFIKFKPNFNVSAHPTITIRFVAQSTADAGLADTDPGVADGPWVASPMPAAADFFDDPTPVDDDGGLCSYNPNGRFDPVLPGLILIALAYLGWRQKRKDAR